MSAKCARVLLLPVTQPKRSIQHLLECGGSTEQSWSAAITLASAQPRPPRPVPSPSARPFVSRSLSPHRKGGARGSSFEEGEEEEEECIRSEEEGERRKVSFVCCAVGRRQCRKCVFLFLSLFGSRCNLSRKGPCWSNSSRPRAQNDVVIERIG